MTVTTWQAERFAIENQTDVIGVVSLHGKFSGLTGGVRFDPAQGRQCLRIVESPGVLRDIPVQAIRELRVL
jgi:hypothetical protein